MAKVRITEGSLLIQVYATNDPKNGENPVAELRVPGLSFIKAPSHVVVGSSGPLDPITEAQPVGVIEPS